ncbi:MULTISPECIES: hypothetical protein [Methylomonas]|uniref:Uncharacterized protein n=2 Tax=Methylomonas TaxID=416 RepID=A0A126T2Z8_9GAMM|nr:MULTISPECIES: hypothetical protein [Methylomonas]AMK76460.1 hypothetical protein JT25_008135 [Methylomonas denitrificans]OAH98718.1 hypothetical protein A1342_12875 [Methylomonas methanica]TCV88494.1 hypothetical protein EDE11_101284 [Methylomonas methanica]
MNKQDGSEVKLRPALRECWLHQTRSHAASQEVTNFCGIKDQTTQELNDARLSRVCTEIVLVNILRLVMYTPIFDKALYIKRVRPEYFFTFQTNISNG